MLVLVAESGAGKTETEMGLCDRGYVKGVSLTTRKPRVGEVHGKDYYFSSVEEVIRMKQTGELAEYVENYGCYYGLTKESCLNSDVVVVELNGIKQLKERKDIPLEVVYLECSEEERKRRMESRGDNPEDIQKRLSVDREMFKDVKSLSDIVIKVDKRSKEEVLNIVEGILKVHKANN